MKANLLFFLRLVVASVWFYEGMWLKLIVVAPNQLAIVKSLGPMAGITPGLFLRCIGVGETLIGVAVLLGRLPRTLAIFQIVLVVTMNVTAMLFASTALENPKGLLLYNLPFLACVAVVGFASPKPGKTT